MHGQSVRLIETSKKRCILYIIGSFEVRVRVRKEIRRNAHVRAKCVRGNISKCEVRACEVKYIAPNILVGTDGICCPAFKT